MKALRTRDLFSGLSPEVVRAFQATFCRTSYPPNSVIFTHGDSVQGLFIVLEGRIRLTANGHNGQRVVLGWVFRQQPFTLGNALTRQPYSFNAEASAHSVVALVPQSDFELLQQTSPELRPWGDRQLWLELEQSRRLHGLRYVTPNLRAAVAGLIVELAEADRRNGHDRLTLCIRQEELGDTLGVRRETINRSMLWLEGQALIQMVRGIIHVPQPGRLRSLAG